MPLALAGSAVAPVVGESRRRAVQELPCQHVAVLAADLARAPSTGASVFTDREL